MSRFAYAVIVGFALAALGVTGCDRDDDGRAAATSPNVLLIVVDTLRADKLGCYGSDLGATPRIDAFAATGQRFERAYAQAPWTLPSFATIFTAQPPPRHRAGGQVGRFRRLPDSARTVAECFRDAGYQTASVVNVDFLTELFGMAQGFEHVDFEVYPNNVRMRPADQATDAAIAWLDGRDERPFFLFVHYFDPHLVYDPPGEYRERFAAPEDRADSSWVFGTRADVVGFRRGKRTFGDATIRRAEKLYNGEVAYTDHELGRLLDALDELKLADTTIVAFTSDHGEEFLEHGGFEHGHSLYDELLHVPLIIRQPGRAGPGVVGEAVGLVDLAPTLCAMAGVAADPAFAGRSLVPLIDGGVWQARPVMLEGNFWGPPYVGWLHEDYKLIMSPNEVRLFNLRTDRGEQRDLSEAEPERCGAMSADLRLALKAMMEQAAGQPQPAHIPPKELERLRSLGYAP